MPTPASVPNVLTIAGSDPSGGAGIQADLKTFSALGVYGLAALTSLTAQNTRGVSAVHVPPATFLGEQLRAIEEDVDLHAVKVGMLATAEVAQVAAAWLERVRPPVVVLDPVMVATSGDRLLREDAVQAVRERLLPLADVVTPNVAELGVLADAPAAAQWQAARDQAARLAAATGVRVLVKGGHLAGTPALPGRSPDALVTADGLVEEFDGPFVPTRNTHGTGCSLSSALAALRPQRPSWSATVADAKFWLVRALRAAGELRVGRTDLPDDGGHGPVHHFHALWGHPDPLPGPVPGDLHAVQDGAVEEAPSVGFADEAWRRTAALRAEIDALPFLTALRDGSLGRATFLAYLDQDAAYLAGYARALARCAELAPTVEEQLWWGRRAVECLAAERDLHERALAAFGSGPGAAPSSVTVAYLDHLHAAGTLGGYARLVAAVLPCFWIYADVGRRLAAQAPDPAHPYREWIDLYADPGFADVTCEARGIADREASRVGAGERAAMGEAFERSARYEWMFWDQAWTGRLWPV